MFFFHSTSTESSYFCPRTFILVELQGIIKKKILGKLRSFRVYSLVTICGKRFFLQVRWKIISKNSNMTPSSWIMAKSKNYSYKTFIFKHLECKISTKFIFGANKSLTLVYLSLDILVQNWIVSKDENLHQISYSLRFLQLLKQWNLTRFGSTQSRIKIFFKTFQGSSPGPRACGRPPHRPSTPSPSCTASPPSGAPSHTTSSTPG